MMSALVLIRGGGEMATGVAAALYRAGRRVIVTEIPEPRAIRRTVAFAEAIYQGAVEVEGIRAVRAESDSVGDVLERGDIPVLVDPEVTIRSTYPPEVLVDAIISKRNAGGTSLGWAPLVVGLGPGFRAGVNCHLVVETARGHFMGRYYDQGEALPDTGVPGNIAGHTAGRLLRAPVDGRLVTLSAIGAQIQAGDTVARVDEAPVVAAIAGTLRGLLTGGLMVKAGEKIGDVDPRGRPEFCHLISDKARLIGSGVLSAILWQQAGRPGRLPPGHGL